MQVRPEDPEFNERQNELERRIYGQIAQCALRTHRLALAKSAVESALDWPVRPGHDLADLEFETMRLDILIAQEKLGPATLLAEQIDIDSGVAVDELMRTWPKQNQCEERWIELSHLVRFRSRMAYLFLLRGQLKPAVDKLVAETCQQLQSCPNLLGSYPLAQSSALSFRIERGIVVPRGLGSQVLLRSALREEVDCESSNRPKPDWLEEAKRLAELGGPTQDAPNPEEAADITLDRYARERWRTDRILRDLELGSEDNPAVTPDMARPTLTPLRQLEERLRALDEQLEVRTLDSKVGPFPGMRLAQERARNELFLYAKYRQLGDHGIAGEHLMRALWILRGLIDLTGTRRYPLLLADALLMSVAARKEAKDTTSGEAIDMKLLRDKDIKDDQDRAHETLEACGYRLRWQEYERTLTLPGTAPFSLTDFDAQAWG